MANNGRKHQNRKPTAKLQDLTPKQNPKGGLGSILSNTVKSIGDALTTVARK